MKWTIPCTWSPFSLPWISLFWLIPNLRDKAFMAMKIMVNDIDNIKRWVQGLTALVMPLINCGVRHTRILCATAVVVTSETIVFRAILAMSRCWSFPFNNLSQSLSVISKTLSSLTFFTSGAKLQKKNNNYNFWMTNNNNCCIISLDENIETKEIKHKFGI